MNCVNILDANVKKKWRLYRGKKILEKRKRISGCHRTAELNGNDGPHGMWPRAHPVTSQALLSFTVQLPHCFPFTVPRRNRNPSWSHAYMFPFFFSIPDLLHLKKKNYYLCGYNKSNILESMEIKQFIGVL